MRIIEVVLNVLTFIIDCDDVLFRCNEYAIELLNKKLGTSYKEEDITSWGATGTDIDLRLAYFGDPEFVRNQPVMPGAREFIKALSRLGEIVICTNVPKQVAGIRIQRILDEFPEIKPGNILIGGRKDMLKGDIMLDDAPHYIRDATVPYPVLFRKPWNAHMTGMLTVSNYDEFLTLVKTIKRKKEESGFTPGKTPKVVAVFGPSGSGKTYLSNELLRNEGFERVITTTTRQIRPGETTSAYNFVSREVFQKMQEDGAFVETAVYHGEKYGTCIHDIKTIMAKGKSPVIVLDINGVLAMKTLYGKSCLAVFVDRDKKECIRSILSRYPGGSVNVDEATERIASIDAEMNNSGLADIVCTSDDADEIRMYMRGESNE